MRRKVHLIVCGGTALTLLNVKASTKDIDLMVPNSTGYEYLMKNIKQMGYVSASGSGWSRGDGFIYDLFRGNRIHTTELIESPLEKKNHLLIKEWSQMYLGVLNYYDLMISKLFRGTTVDMEDCLSLMRSKYGEIDLNRFEKRFHETAQYEVSEDKVNKHLDRFFTLLEKEGIGHAQ